MKKLAYLSALYALLILSAAAQAQESGPPSYLGFGIGLWDALDGDDTAADFRAEYRHGETLFWKIKPYGGLEVTADGSLWGGAGVLADFKPADNFYITPAFGIGLYAQGGSDKDLDFPIQFRSQLEAGYEFTGSQRLGLAISHISNAHLGDDNPGTDILTLYYHIPVGSLF